MTHLEIAFRRLIKIRKTAGLTILMIVAVLVSSTYGLVWIWDSTNLQWTTTLKDGEPIDTTADRNATAPQTAVDSSGNIYTVFRQIDGAGNGRIYMSRYESSGLVTIWDNDSQTWTLNLASVVSHK